MRISKTVVVVAALCFGLAIGGPIYLVRSKFHPSHVEAGNPGPRPAFVKEEPEGFIEKWGDPVALATLALTIVTYLLYRSAVATGRDAKTASEKALAASTTATETLVPPARAVPLARAHQVLFRVTQSTASACLLAGAHDGGAYVRQRGLGWWLTSGCYGLHRVFIPYAVGR
jgi:hypothetical protein